jgi:hypothetical protein
MGTKAKDIFSWQGLIKRAVFIALVFLAAHLLNGREFAGSLFGTYTVLGLQRIIGVTYALFYLLFTIVSPTFLIAALLVFLAERAGLVNGKKNVS